MTIPERSTEWWVDLIEDFEREWQKEQAKLRNEFDTAIEQRIGAGRMRRCERCSRIMVPRRAWDSFPKGERPVSGFAPAGSQGHCHSCHNTAKVKGDLIPKRKTPLSPEQLQRLRSLVGFKRNG